MIFFLICHVGRNITKHNYDITKAKDMKRYEDSDDAVTLTLSMEKDGGKITL